VAASLAVIVAAINGISSLKMTQMQDEERQPFVEASLKIRDFAGGKLLTLVNTGRTSAYEVKVSWTFPIPDDGSEHFPEIRRLPPGVPMAWKLPNNFDKSTNGYSGSIDWQNSHKRKFKEPITWTQEDIESHAFARAVHEHDTPQQALIQEIGNLVRALQQLTSPR